MCVSTEAFKQFLSEDFDVKDHANKVIQGMVITQQLGKLAEGISLLDKEIHTQVHVWLHCTCIQYSEATKFRDDL